MSAGARLRLFLLVCFLVILFPLCVLAQPRSIRVVMDDNYPPFSFRDDKGRLQGILIDQWRLWERNTGIAVEINGMDWGKALSRMKAGEFDVIDTIFLTPERQTIFSFTHSYQQIEVPIFFNDEIAGITDAASLKGFSVAAKRDDAVIELLRRNGVDNLLLFDSYEAVIHAARDHKVNVFVIDKPPANYFLHKLGIHEHFKQSAPLYVGEFRRAVRKDNQQLLALVEDGFDRITPGEFKQIEDTWYGSRLLDGRNGRNLLIIAGGLGLLALALFGWNRALKRKVDWSASALKASEDRYRTIFEQASAGILLSSSNGSVIEVNSRMEILTGWSGEQLSRMSVSDIFSPESLKAAPFRYDLLNEGRTMVSQRELVRPDGSRTSVEMFSSLNSDGDCLSICHDITDRIRAEEERLSLERQLLHAQKLESLGIMSGGIAHDFNNLLQAILGNLDLALMRLDEYSDIRAFLLQALTASNHAARLTGMMLTYSGKGVFITRELNLSELVAENAALIHATISKAVTLKLNLDYELAPVMADTGQLQQVVMNLIINASEAISGNDGQITLTTAVRRFDQASLNRSRLEEKLVEGEYVCLEVADNGCGMDQKTLQKLFDPFFTTKFTGRGLGMSAVLGIMRAHQGALLVDSAPGGGTTIRVLLPGVKRSQDASSAGYSAANVDSFAVDPGRCLGTVLVVDDEAMVRRLSVAMFKRFGFEVLSAESGAEALRIFREQGDRIGLVVLDQVMPGMDGATVLRELRGIRPDVRVLLVSGFSEHEVLACFKGMEPAGFLRKPYDMASLRSELSRVMDGPGMDF